MLIAPIASIDQVLQAHAAALGPDLIGYRNHACRVANLCVSLTSPSAEAVEKIALAAAFQDLGIWTHGTLDYLAPSIELAGAHLARIGRTAWTPEVSAMILEHHKRTPCRGDPAWLVEPFRRADPVDVSRGAARFGLPRATLSEIFARWPSAGFHARLLRLSLGRLRTHPRSPLPMLRF